MHTVNTKMDKIEKYEKTSYSRSNIIIQNIKLTLAHFWVSHERYYY